MKDSMRWGIWGTGAIAHRVASDLRLAPGCVLHAVASRTIERAKEFADQHLAARCYEGLESLLDDMEVDVVYIATPNQCHMEDCLACIRAGKAVMCEKPLALNLAQAQQIVKAARARKIFCMEAMWTRFIPAVVEAKRSIAAGEIGRVRLVQGNFSYPAWKSGDSRLFDLETGGGALLDRGVYLISLAQHLLGVPESIGGTMSVATTGVDEQSSYQLTFAGGALADMVAGLAVRGTNDFTITGERGSLRLDAPFYCAHRLEMQSYAAPAMVQPGAAPSQGSLGKLVRRLRDAPSAKLLWRRISPWLKGLRRARAKSFAFAGNGYQFELMEVNQCLRDDRTESLTMPLDDSLAVMRTMDALRAQWGLVFPQECAELQNR